MKPIAWYDPTNGAVSTDKDSPLFTPLGQVLPLYTKQEQEPVAWGVFEGNLHDIFFTQSEAQEMANLKGTHAEVRPLYTTPPQRTWVGLTDEEIKAFDTWHDNREEEVGWVNPSEIVAYIETKLKEKNG
jgi:hypothetical protein